MLKSGFGRIVSYSTAIKKKIYSTFGRCSWKKSGFQPSECNYVKKKADKMAV